MHFLKENGETKVSEGVNWNGICCFDTDERCRVWQKERRTHVGKGERIEAHRCTWQEGPSVLER